MIITGGIYRNRSGVISSTPSGAAGGALSGTYPNPDLASTVAGNGLGISSNVLSVNVDGVGIEINSDTLRLKDAGVAAAKLVNSGVHTGDATGTFPTVTLANSGVSAASYGSSTQIPNVTFDAKGRATTASTVNLGKLADSDAATNITINGSDQINVSNNSLSTMVIYSDGAIDHPLQSAVIARLTSDQTISDSTYTTLSLATEDKDTQNEWNTSTYTFTAERAGLYQVSAVVAISSMPDRKILIGQIRKNGTGESLNNLHTSSASTTNIACTLAKLISLAANDTLDLQVYQDSGLSKTAQAVASINYLSIMKVA